MSYSKSKAVNNMMAPLRHEIVRGPQPGASLLGFDSDDRAVDVEPDRTERFFAGTGELFCNDGLLNVGGATQSNVFSGGDHGRRPGSDGNVPKGVVDAAARSRGGQTAEHVARGF